MFFVDELGFTWVEDARWPCSRISTATAGISSSRAEAARDAAATRCRSAPQPFPERESDGRDDHPREVPTTRRLLERRPVRVLAVTLRAAGDTSRDACSADTTVDRSVDRIGDRRFTVHRVTLSHGWPLGCAAAWRAGRRVRAAGSCSDRPTWRGRDRGASRRRGRRSLRRRQRARARVPSCGRRR